MKDVRERIRVVYPLVEISPEASISKLPTVLTELLAGAAIFKIEWMFDGGYEMMSSGEFKAAFGFNFKGNIRNVYRKVQDTLGFSNYDTAYKMWTETLHRPGMVIRYQGRAYRENLKATVCQIARMCSVIYDFEHVVTVTVVN